jgi:Restriction endonuclease
MNLEPLTRLIETAGFLEFRELAMRYLELSGYSEVTLKDGWNDGGSDFAVAVHGGNMVPLAIQITVQRAEWESKVKSDFRRAKNELGLTQGVYITSRRIAQVPFTDVADELWAQDTISVRSVDSQSLASLFFKEAEADFVLDTLGISRDTRRPDIVPRPDLKEDAAYSFMVFGDASEKFRQSVVEQTVLSYLTRPASEYKRDATETAVVAALGLHHDQVSLVTSAIDRMLQNQRLRLIDGVLAVDKTIAEGFRVMRTLREEQWRRLGRQVDSYLATDAGLAGAGLERASDIVMKGAGSLFLAAASSASMAVSTERISGPLGGQIRKRLNEIAKVLVASGVSEASLDVRLQTLASLVSNSEIGRVLMAGELFVALASIEARNFERAFGADAGTEIYLDASVAIPMIAGLLYEPGSHRFSSSAAGVYELAGRRGMSLLLPRVYLEEAATHLLHAVERYQPLLGTDEDLRFSTNSFVAHFTDLSSRNAIKVPFSQYADSLGYTKRPTSFVRQRDSIMGNLAALFGRYGVKIVDLPRTKSSETHTYAQEAATFTAAELHLQRTGILLEHDASVIAFFMDPESEASAARVLCSWDRLHLQLQSSSGPARWAAFNPPTLCDLLILTRAHEDGELTTTINVAMELGEEDGQRGADVLDALVRIESGALHDAELLGLAAQFKDAYMEAIRRDEAPDDLAEAWAGWKGGRRELVRQSELPLQ